MRLKDEDVIVLKRYGNSEDDIRQIKEAAKAKYTVYKMNGKRITAEQAIAVLGRREYLSGLSRSAFHYTCAREGLHGEIVDFDSSALFR